MNAHTTPIHIIDFEGNTRCGIIEYGVVTLKGGDIVSTETRLCCAQGEVSSRDTQQHGIQKSDTLQMAPFSDEWALFSELRKTGPLAAHHASVENGLLKNVWPYPSQSPDFLNVDQTIADWGPWVDTCQLFQVVYPDLESFKLSHLIDVFALQSALDEVVSKYCPEKRQKYHCALYDALGSALLLKHLLELPGYGAVTVAWLIHNSTRSKGKREGQQQKRLF